MSELKAGVIVTPHDEGMCFNTDSDVIAVTERETKFYLKTEADAVIAEKDAAIAELTEKNKRLEEFKDKYSGCAEKAINTIAKCELKIRRLSRALFKACANWATSERYTEATWHGDEHREELWANVQAKCLAKAQEYKND